MALARAVQRRRGLPPEEDADQDIREPPTTLNAVLSAALSLEGWWLRIADAPFGSSLLCLARKPG